jgi:tetratricopeptide (TPR) repeat protein
MLLACASAGASQSQRGDEVSAIVQRGEELNNQGKYEEAIVEFRKVVDLDARNSHALFRMAEAQFKLGNLQDALNTLTKAAVGDLQPMWIKVWTYVNLGKIFDIRGQRFRAIPMYQGAVDTGDDSFGAQAEAKKCLNKPCEEHRIVWPSP